MAININIDIDTTALASSDKNSRFAQRQQLVEGEIDKKTAAKGEKQVAPIIAANQTAKDNQQQGGATARGDGSGWKRIDQKPAARRFGEGYSVAGFDWSFDIAGLGGGGPFNFQNGPAKVRIQPARTEQIFEFDILGENIGYEGYDNSNRLKTNLAVIDTYDRVISSSLISTASAIFPAGGEYAVLVIYFHRHNSRRNVKWTLSREWTETIRYNALDYLRPAPDHPSNPFLQGNTIIDVFRYEGKIEGLDLGVEENESETFKSFLIGPRTVTEIGTPPGIEEGMEAYITRYAHVLTEGTFEQTQSCIAPSGFFERPESFSDALPPVTSLYEASGGLVEYGSSAPEVTNEDGTAFMRDYEIVYFYPWETHDFAPCEEYLFAEWLYFEGSAELSGYWDIFTSYWNIFRTTFSIAYRISPPRRTTQVTQSGQSISFEISRIGSDGSVIGPGVFFAFSNPSVQPFSQTAIDIVALYFATNLQPRVSLFPTYTNNGLRFDYSKGLYNGLESSSDLNAAASGAKTNPKALFRNGSPGFTWVWDWGKPAYCRQQLSLLGFSLEDLS